MKVKMILTALCLCICLGAMAQRPNRDRSGAPGMPRHTDAVVDTAILNKMNLEAKMLSEILALKTAKQAENKENMKGMRPEKGKKMDEATRKAIREKQTAFTAGYRAELRKIMGDELYISYLEKQVDSRNAMRANMRPQNNNMNNGMRNQYGQRGGFGNNDFGGGSMGGDF